MPDVGEPDSRSRTMDEAFTEREPVTKMLIDHMAPLFKSFKLNVPSTTASGSPQRPNVLTATSFSLLSFIFPVSLSIPSQRISNQRLRYPGDILRHYGSLEHKISLSYSILPTLSEQSPVLSVLGAPGCTGQKLFCLKHTADFSSSTQRPVPPTKKFTIATTATVQRYLVPFMNDWQDTTLCQNGAKLAFWAIG